MMQTSFYKFQVSEEPFVHVHYLTRVLLVGYNMTKVSGFLQRLFLHSNERPDPLYSAGCSGQEFIRILINDLDGEDVENVQY
jgi:hypothetical protein